MGGLPFPAELMEAGRISPGIRQAKGVRQLLGQGQRLVGRSQGLVWIAEMPQGIGPGQAEHPQVEAEQEGLRAVLLGIVEGEALGQWSRAEAKFAQAEQRGSPQ